MKEFDPSNTKPGKVPTLEELRGFLVAHKLGVILTNGALGYPNGAVVGYSVHSGFELIVGTSDSTVKAANVANDEKTGFVIYDSDSRETVQLTADARILSQDEFETGYAELHYEQRPESAPFRDKPGEVHIALTPVCLKYTDADASPWVVTYYAGEQLRADESSTS